MCSLLATFFLGSAIKWNEFPSLRFTQSLPYTLAYAIFRRFAFVSSGCECVSVFFFHFFLSATIFLYPYTTPFPFIFILVYRRFVYTWRSFMGQCCPIRSLWCSHAHTKRTKTHEHTHTYPNPLLPLYALKREHTRYHISKWKWFHFGLGIFLYQNISLSTGIWGFRRSLSHSHSLRFHYHFHPPNIQNRWISRISCRPPSNQILYYRIVYEIAVYTVTGPFLNDRDFIQIDYKYGIMVNANNFPVGFVWLQTNGWTSAI